MVPYIPVTKAAGPKKRSRLPVKPVVDSDESSDELAAVPKAKAKAAASKESDAESSSSPDAQAPDSLKSALEFANNPPSSDDDDEEPTTPATTKKKKQGSEEGNSAKPAAAAGVKRGRANSADSGSAPRKTLQQKHGKVPKPSPVLPPDEPSSSNEEIGKPEVAPSTSSEDDVGSQEAESSSSEELLDVTSSAVANTGAKAMATPSIEVEGFVDQEKIECIVDTDSRLNKHVERNSRGLVYRSCAKVEERVGKRVADRSQRPVAQSLALAES